MESGYFLGGKPFYSMYEGSLFNVFLYPFYLIADPDNYTQSYYVLYLIHICYMYYSGAGLLFFRKKDFKDQLYGVCGFRNIIFTAPHILLYIDSFHPAIIYAVIPWVLYSICRYFETKKLKWWLLGLFFLIMMELAYDTNTIIRVYIIVFLILFLIWVLIYSKRGKPLLTLFGFGLMFYSAYAAGVLMVMHI